MLIRERHGHSIFLGCCMVCLELAETFVVKLPWSIEVFIGESECAESAYIVPHDLRCFDCVYKRCLIHS